MPVFYKLQQNKNASMASSYQKWYARPVVAGVKDINDVADIVQRNCSMKKSDVLAVITESVEVMKDMLQDSMRVHLNGLGAFKLGISSKGAENVEDFTVSENIKKVRVIFQPETITDASTGKRSKILLQGASLSDISKLASKEQLDAEAEAKSSETTNP